MSDDIKTTEEELLNQQEQLRRQQEIELHNLRVDFNKAFKKRKTPEEILDYKKAIVEELVTSWSQDSLTLRLPGVVASGLAIHVAQFFKDNVEKIPTFTTYDENVTWIFNVATYLLALDKEVFWFLKTKLGTEGTTQIAHATVKENEIGPSSRLIHMFQKDSLFFFGRDVWSFFLNNENILKSPEFDMVESVELLSTGKIGRFRGTALFTDGMRHKEAACLDTFEGFFVSIPVIQTVATPKLTVAARFSKTDFGNEWWKSLSYSVDGEDFVKTYCKRIVMT